MKHSSVEHDIWIGSCHFNYVRTLSHIKSTECSDAPCFRCRARVRCCCCCLSYVGANAHAHQTTMMHSIRPRSLSEYVCSTYFHLQSVLPHSNNMYNVHASSLPATIARAAFLIRIHVSLSTRGTGFELVFIFIFFFFVSRFLGNQFILHAAAILFLVRAHVAYLRFQPKSDMKYCNCIMIIILLLYNACWLISDYSIPAERARARADAPLQIGKISILANCSEHIYIWMRMAVRCWCWCRHPYTVWHRWCALYLANFFPSLCVCVCNVYASICAHGAFGSDLTYISNNNHLLFLERYTCYLAEIISAHRVCVYQPLMILLLLLLLLWSSRLGSDAANLRSTNLNITILFNRPATS